MQDGRVGYPTYGAKLNIFGGTPTYVFLDWNAANKPTGDDQYKTWTWTLRETILGYRYCSLVSVAFQASNYTTTPKYIGLNFDKLNAPNLRLCSTASCRDAPSFLVPNLDPSLTTGAQFSDIGRDEYMAYVSQSGITQLQFTFLDETLQPPAVVAVPPGGFYFYVYLKFWN